MLDGHTSFRQRVEFLLRALKPNLWFVLGGVTPWLQDDIPLTLSPHFAQLPGFVGAVPVGRLEIVYAHAQGSILLPEGRFNVYSGERTPAELTRHKCHQLYYEGIVDAHEIIAHPEIRAWGIAEAPNASIPTNYRRGQLMEELPAPVYLHWACGERPAHTLIDRFFNIQVLRSF